MAEKASVHIFVSGRVQGVYFRENARKKAQELGVFGWIRNLIDGRVEAVFEGEKRNVEEIVNWAKRGPIWAKVEDIQINWQDYKGEFNNFEIKYN